MKCFVGGSHGSLWMVCSILVCKLYISRGQSPTCPQGKCAASKGTAGTLLLQQRMSKEKQTENGEGEESYADEIPDDLRKLGEEMSKKNGEKEDGDENAITEPELEHTSMVMDSENEDVEHVLQHGEEEDDENSITEPELERTSMVMDSENEDVEHILQNHQSDSNEIEEQMMEDPDLIDAGKIEEQLMEVNEVEEREEANLSHSGMTCWEPDHASTPIGRNPWVPPGTYKNVPNIHQCQHMCKKNSQCKWFAYRQKGWASGACHLKTTKGHWVGGDTVLVGPQNCVKKIRGYWKPHTGVPSTHTYCVEVGISNTLGTEHVRSFSTSVTNTFTETAGASIEVEGIGASQEVSRSKSRTKSMSSSFTTSAHTTLSQKKTKCVDGSKDKSNYRWEWQWVMDVTISGSPDKTYTTFTSHVAMTQNQAMKPRCYPGYMTDNYYYQQCVNGYWLPGAHAPSRSRNPCKDNHHHCRWYRGYCHWHSWVQRNCKKTCGRCR